MIICLSVLGFVFFRRANQYVQLGVFLCLFGGVVAFGVSISNEASTKNTSSSGPTPTPASPTPSIPSLDAAGYARRGQEYYDAANWKLAEKSYREAVDLDPGNEPYNFMLGQSLYAQSRFAEAEIAFRGAVALSPNSGSNIYQLGITLIELGKYEEAVTALRQAKKRFPGDPNVQAALARAIRGLKQ